MELLVIDNSTLIKCRDNISEGIKMLIRRGILLTLMIVFLFSYSGCAIVSKINPENISIDNVITEVSLEANIEEVEYLNESKDGTGEDNLNEEEKVYIKNEIKYKKDWETEDISADSLFVNTDGIIVKTNGINYVDNTGKVKWKTLVSGPKDSRYYVDEKVVALTNGSYVVVMDKDSGKVIWEFEMSEETFTTPVAYDGILLVTSMNGLLYAFDMLTGALLWDYVPEDGMLPFSALSDPVIYNGRVIYTGYNKIYAVNIATQKECWRNEDIIADGPQIYMIDDNVLVINYDGNIYSLDAETGDIIWKILVENKDYADINSVVKENTMYISINSDHFYGINLNEGTIDFDLVLTKTEDSFHELNDLCVGSNEMILPDKNGIVLIDVNEKKVKKLGVNEFSESKITTIGDSLYFIVDGKVVKYKTIKE
ncbi:MAG: bamB [Herbinix sp.]|jgi:outer membrane protein assembly factor BamB|nr:bamB [Herbinix sp.]